MFLRALNGLIGPERNPPNRGVMPTGLESGARLYWSGAQIQSRTERQPQVLCQDRAGRE